MDADHERRQSRQRGSVESRRESFMSVDPQTSPATGIDPATFRRVLGHFATGVTVVTTRQSGRRAGITVNAFCSVSLDPPLVLVCVEHTNYTHDLLLETGYFAANFLSADQASVSRCFAGRGPAKYQDFCGVATHTEATGAPVFDDCLAWVDCRVVAVYPGGDHSILIGRVEALGSREATPLLFYGTRYGRLVPQELDLGPSTETLSAPEAPAMPAATAPPERPRI
jgi:flavin reductase (DIM6/NTAB) family NADH-FMN oxidoreductase RutF